MTDKQHAELLAALDDLRSTVTDENLNDDGRYFLDGYGDLTQCHHGETGNFRNRADGKAIAILWKLWRDGLFVPERADEWRPMRYAPRDGRVIEACARLPSATAGFPQFIQWGDAGWRTVGYDTPREVLPWAWRPRTSWPMDEEWALQFGGERQARITIPIEEITDGMLRDLLTTEQITPERYQEEIARRKTVNNEHCDEPQLASATDPKDA